MNSKHIVAMLLGEEPEPRVPLSEASVSLPPRSRVWVAVYTGPTPGHQVRRSTGLTDREQALVLAQKWESEARAQRAVWGRFLKKPTIRVRRQGHGSPAEQLTQQEVATLLRISVRGVREIERRALRKLYQHPQLRQIWRKYLAGELDEQDQRLTPAEIEALLALARTRQERQLLQRVLRRRPPAAPIAIAL